MQPIVTRYLEILTPADNNTCALIDCQLIKIIWGHIIDGDDDYLQCQQYVIHQITI